MKSLFVTTMNAGAPLLPPMVAEDGGLQLSYPPAPGKVVHGGYAVKSYVPDESAIVLVDASPATIAAMKLLDDYLWLEDVPEAADAV